MPKRFVYTEATLASSSEAGHIADVQQFLYLDNIFSKSSARLRKRLKFAFNLCSGYIHGFPL
jgi:hypothetical protein